MTVITCENVVKTYNRQAILKNITFMIEEKKITGLIGRNGVGKSTLLHLIKGNIRPTKGDIQVLSHKPFNDLLVSANTILVDEQMLFPSSISLKEILEEGKRFYPNWDQSINESLFL